MKTGQIYAVVAALVTATGFAATWSRVDGSIIEGVLLEANGDAGTFVIRHKDGTEGTYKLINLIRKDRELVTKFARLQPVSKAEKKEEKKASFGLRARQLLYAWGEGMGLREMILFALVSIGVHGILLFFAGKLLATQEASLPIVTGTTTLMQAATILSWYAINAVIPVLLVPLGIAAAVAIGIFSVQFIYEGEWKESAVIYGAATAAYLVLTGITLAILSVHMIRSGAAW